MENAVLSTLHELWREKIRAARRRGLALDIRFLLYYRRCQKSGKSTTPTTEVQEKLYKVVSLLEINGPSLSFPYSSDIRGASIALRELRAQCGGHPYRVLYAFDPLRSAVLLIGGDKTGDDRWYERMIPMAERIYGQYLNELREVNDDTQI